MRLSSALHDISTVEKLLTGAEDESRRTGDSLPGAEHLLLAAIALADGTAGRAFERVDADPEQFRGAIGTTHANALHDLGIVAGEEVYPAPEAGTIAPARGLLRTNASAQQAFQAAVKLSKATKPSRLLGAHVVLAVCQMEHGTVALALATLGIDRAALGAAASQELAAVRAGR